MVEIISVQLPAQKAEICDAILRVLPDWFGIESAIREYVRDVRPMQFWAAMDGDTPVGFAALKQNTAYAAELYVTGVQEAYHRQGIGRRLVAQCIAACREKGLKYLTVKTLDESARSESYDHTRAFYRAMGFVPLEVFPTLWDPHNPCLLMVLALD